MLIPEKQYKILLILAKEDGRLRVEELSKKLSVDPSVLMRDLAELENMGLIDTEKITAYEIRLSDEGKRYLSKGFPEERLLKALLKQGKSIPLSIVFSDKFLGEFQLERKEAKIGLSHLISLKTAKVKNGILELTGDPDRALAEIRDLRLKLKDLDGVTTTKLKDYIIYFKRRRLIDVRDRKILEIGLTKKATLLLKEGKLKPVNVVTRLTPELILTGEWRSVYFKKFDLSVEIPELYPARKHPYMELLDEIREILVSLGFEEVKGPHVELEFWNFDVLFQAQDHPAREIHDTFFLKKPSKGTLNDKDLIEKVKETHENGWKTGSKGWGYKWSLEKALKLILRTQTTAVSMRALYEKGEGEYRCFSLDRVFRPETLDPTHSMEFYQLEGIMVGENVTFRNLLWFFNVLADKLGLGRVKIKPAYFPFTEPSVEGFIKHPKLGWIEVFPGGMFRPEVLRPLGIEKCNVAAWGIGIDRIAMALLDIDDIRDLFSPRISFLRGRKVPLIKSLLG